MNRSGFIDRTQITQWDQISCMSSFCTGQLQGMPFEFPSTAYCPDCEGCCKFAKTFLYCRGDSDCLQNSECAQDTGKCRAKGKACVAQDDCAADEYCEDPTFIEGGSATCKPRLPRGGFCFVDFQCPYGCNIYSATCNYCQADTNCEGQWCDALAGTCNPRLSDGAACFRDTQCQVGSTCQNGFCGVATCGVGFTNCGGTCKDTSSDPKNCGSCGNTCGLGDVCSSGVCGTPEICNLCFSFEDSRTWTCCEPTQFCGASFGQCRR